MLVPTRHLIHVLYNLICVDQVGGSLGGLFAGIVFKRLGHAVRIFERNPTPLLHDQGAGIVAGGDAQAFFGKYDRTHRSIAVPSKLRHYLDKEGHQIHRENTTQQMTSWDLLYHLLRANFDGVKSDYCEVPPSAPSDGSGSYEYGHMVKGIRDGHDGKVEVDFEDRDGNKTSESVDMLIGSDGASSTLRKILLPDVKREYAGYVAWRGTVPEVEVSKSAKDAFIEKFAFYHSEGVQILSYTIPGKYGSLEAGKRLVNYVWYCNYPQDSEEYRELMTDSDGHRHHTTLPAGKMRPEIWDQQKDYARRILPPQFAEIVQKTTQPFIQAITDVLSPRNSFFDGKVLLVGDAVAGFRPHTAASTSQAAFDALMLSELMSGEMDNDQWQEKTMNYARDMQRRGVEMGQRSQFGHHPLSR
ncbi:hypothetical protein MMC18_007487 [Xylographa bjoerkii]|nr:hypothetical protein [Xylographa bjoerkii]